MKITKKKIKQLHDELVEIRTEQSENNSRIERKLGARQKFGGKK